MAKAKASAQAKPQEHKKHPDEWDKEVNPNRLEGQNTGRQNRQDLNLPSAADIKVISGCLGNFTVQGNAFFKTSGAGPCARRSSRTCRAPRRPAASMRNKCRVPPMASNTTVALDEQIAAVKSGLRR